MFCHYLFVFRHLDIYIHISVIVETNLGILIFLQANNIEKVRGFWPFLAFCRDICQ